MNEFLEKVKKIFLGPFCPNLGKREFSGKIGLCHFFTLMNLQLHAKYQKKTNEPILSKMRY